MEPATVIKNHPQPPARRWRVGDLTHHRSYGRCLILGVQVGIYHRYNLITEAGFQFETDTPPTFSHNTGLQYAHVAFAQTARDYEAGFFTPYFEIL